MLKIRPLAQTRLLGVFSIITIMMSIVLLPLTTSMASAESTCNPPPDPGPGVHHPVGADAAQFVYNCGTGLWASSHFVYNPATGAYTATDATTYTYNAGTGAYDYTYWVYNSPSGKYLLNSASVATPPSGAHVVGAPAPASASISNTGPSSTNSVSGNGGNSSISNTGANSSNSIGSGSNGNSSTNNTNGLSVANLINQTAGSGNGIVLGNTSAGSALTGNALDTSTIVNMLQSASSALGSGNVVSFVQDINGDVNGDLLFDPAALSAIQPAAGNSGSDGTISFNNSTDAAITNDIKLGANSGNATVSQNTTAGDATTGNASVVANVVNLINSAVSSGRSFIGTININGNLNGDILLPPNLIDQLIAANVPTVNIKANNTSTQNITNNVIASAASGQANVSGNTTAGNATTGTASTNITAFNLTGSSVLGKNAILVFVNVTGKWVGLIVNAPAGSTAAALGGSISQSGPNSNNSIGGGSGGVNSDINNVANQAITNNITAAAQSGNANVTGNTKAGNAKSGNASSAVNLLNVENSSLSFSDWFGVLFINVFGTWNGSFGVNTSAGDPVVVAQGVASGAAPSFLSFAPGGIGSKNKSVFYHSSSSGNGTNSGSNSNGSESDATPAVLAGTRGGQSGGGFGAGAGASESQHGMNWGLIAASSSLFFIYLAGDYAYSSYAARRHSTVAHN
jgi:hypothetical protein